jgi:DNA-binding NtrC family response regulator
MMAMVKISVMKENQTDLRDLILLVDDDVSHCRLLERWLTGGGYEVTTFATGEACLAALAELLPSAVCLDLHMPGIGGLATLEKLRLATPHVPVIMLTADGEVENAVKAVQIGAYDYLVKPVNRSKLLTEVRNAVERGRMAIRLMQLEREADGGDYSGLIGQSPPMISMFRQMDRLATSDISVLIHGESGSGKELVARAIHDHSGRSSGPFAAVNCAAIPESLQESELFGHEKGAFTGATQRKSGRFEEADRGTLFLDEVAELSLSLQAKLLRALQGKNFRRVGGTREISSDFRLITATHRDLENEAKNGRFREDLFFRVAVFELEIPALRERGDDIPVLALHFLEKYAADGVAPILSADALRILTAYSWPGNVRELENAIQHSLVVSSGVQLRAPDLPPRIRSAAREAEASSPTADHLLEPDGNHDSMPLTTLAELERLAIERTIKHTKGNLSEACRVLGIGRTTFYRKLKGYGIEK